MKAFVNPINKSRNLYNIGVKDENGQVIKWKLYLRSWSKSKAYSILSKTQHDLDMGLIQVRPDAIAQ